MFRISQEQAHGIALSIYSDIQSYINAHRAEYEVFLANEEKKIKTEKKNDSARFYKK